MANYATLKAAVQEVVKSNGNKEITGTNMQSTLLGMITSLAGGYLFKGIGTTSTSPGTPDQNVFYLVGAGTYTNFGDSYTVPVGSIGVFRYNGSWSRSALKLYDGVDIEMRPLFAAKGNAWSMIRELYLTGLDSSTEYIVASLYRSGSNIKFQINKRLEGGSQSVAYVSFADTLNGKLVYVSPTNDSGISGYAVLDVPTDATGSLAAYPAVDIDVVSNIDNSPTVKDYLNAGINTIIPLVSVHDDSSQRPALSYGDYFVENKSIYCNINITNSIGGKRFVSYNGKYYRYGTDGGYDDPSNHALHEIVQADTPLYQAIALSSGAGINGNEVTVEVPAASSLDNGYYDNTGVGHLSSTNWGLLKIPVTIGKKYFLSAIMSNSVGVVALDANGKVIDNLKLHRMYVYDASLGYSCYCTSYENVAAAYLVVSIYKQYINVTKYSVKLLEADYANDLSLTERAERFNSLGADVKEIVTDFPAAFTDLNVGYYTKTGTYGEHANFRHYRLPIESGKRYYVECYIRNNLGIVSLDADGNVVDVVPVFLSETSGNYSLGTAVYYNTSATYLALSVQNASYELYIEKLKVIESTPADNETSDYRNEISIGSVFARLQNVPLKIAFFGDSTYDGTNTTGYTGHAAWDEDHGGMGASVYVNEKAFPYLLQQTLRTTFGNDNLTCYNVGYSGKYAAWGNDNFATIFGSAYADSDVIVIGFGINDRLYFNNNINNLRTGFKSAMLSIIGKVRALGKTPVLMTAQAGWQFAIKNAHQGTTYDKMTFSYIPACVCDEVKRDIAREENIELIDLNTFDYHLLISGKYNPLQICSDSLHFGDLGHVIESCWLAKVFNPRTQEIGKGERITYINEMVKSDFIMDVDFADDAEWYKKLSMTAASADLTKEAINICIFTKESCTMTAIGTNVAVTINGTASTTEVSLDAFKYYNVVVYPAATGAVEFKGFEFA